MKDNAIFAEGGKTLESSKEKRYREAMVLIYWRLGQDGNHDDVASLYIVTGFDRGIHNCGMGLILVSSTSTVQFNLQCLILHFCHNLIVIYLFIFFFCLISFLIVLIDFYDR